ncbi:CHAT domain-containing protein [Ephemerocybe angulata]|uniref:CHAT domain-containing protein n=1 Tax=Ephemerocybe angulata TaxID=980116 RepID=A0A8H6HEF3_9AGAR|nr:CHAT domain-containing protein [Tulosesus angulatus]
MYASQNIMTMLAPEAQHTKTRNQNPPFNHFGSQRQTMERLEDPLVTDNTSGSKFYLTYINFERTDSTVDYKPLFNLAELSVLGIPGSTESKSFELFKATSRRWQMKGVIELLAEMDGIDCVVKCDKGEDVAFIHLDAKRMRRSPSAEPERGIRHRMEMCDPQTQLGMVWRVAAIPSEGVSVTNTGADATSEDSTQHLLPFQRAGLAALKYSQIANTWPSDMEDPRYTSDADPRYRTGPRPPKTRPDILKLWAHSVTRHHTEEFDIIQSFDTVFAVIPGLSPGLESTVKKRFTSLAHMSGLAPEAGAAACALNRADKALEWLEQGRCNVWSHIHHLRTPLDDLRNHDEDLANNIADVSKQLELLGSSRGQYRLGMSSEEEMALSDETHRHSHLAEERKALLEQARAIPGFQSFLMPYLCSTLMQHLPDSGPIIVINVDERRCDALALMAGLDKPLLIPLLKFSYEKAKNYQAILNSLLRTRNLRDRSSEPVTGEPGRGMEPAPFGKHGEDPPIHQVLRGLWEEVVKPIMNALGYSSVDRATGEVPPRVWWCPTGPLSFLPLHAAGRYRGLNPESVLEYVVSSYTPTVTAINQRVKAELSVDSKASGLFLTSQPNAPGATPIPGTTSEVQSIFNQAHSNGVRALKLEGDEMSVTECFERMLDFSSIHLACHGSQNAAQPLQSHFLFHQGSLELGKILQANLKNADLAFLSACQTSTGEGKLPDEAVHLAAGMLAAGYRRVVGTMWSIGDRPAQEVATTFYEYLFTHQDKSGGATFDASLSAVALHHATQQLRRSLDDSERSLLTWVPFVHFGY